MAASCVAGCDFSYLSRDFKAQSADAIALRGGGGATILVSIKQEIGTMKEEILRTEVDRAFRESGRFSRVQLGKGSEPIDPAALDWIPNAMTAHVEVRSDSYNFSFLAILTLAVIPDYHSETFFMTMSIENLQGKETTATRKIARVTWTGWLMPPISGSDSKYEHEIPYELTAALLRDLSSKGAF